MILCILTILLTVAADQLTKYAAVAGLKGGASFPLVDGILHFTYVENPGAAFGMLADKRWIFMTMSVAAIIGLSVWLIATRPKSTAVRFAVSLIIAGGIGNMIDRVANGYVVDFIDVRAVDFYVFNLADAATCVGSGLLIIFIIVSELKDAKMRKASAAVNEGDDNDTDDADSDDVGDDADSGDSGGNDK